MHALLPQSILNVFILAVNFNGQSWLKALLMQLYSEIASLIKTNSC